MKATEQHIEDLHFEHKLWLSEANFYRDELKVYHKQAQELGKRNTSADAEKRVVHFEHEFKISNRELESLFEEINDHEHSLADFEQNISTEVVNKQSAEHIRMRKRFHEFKEQYSSLKSEFMHFLEDLM